ncbi:MAG: hypothetical protein JNM95_01800 [Chitinophagaceae bacterium]|nr:hypothetical protein [Chitinophagaceae bacterium]
MNKHLFLLFFLLAGGFLQAQTNYSLEDYKKKPYWISMMDEANPNYFEVQKAFTAYWEHHTMPEGEGDMNIKEKEKNKRRFSKKEIRIAREEAAMRMAIKKYRWWIMKMEPFVQDDGSIKRQ